MILKRWQDLPKKLQTKEVRPYYDILARKKTSLALKRLFDLAASGLLLVILWPVFLALAVAIRRDSKGPIFFRQIRATQYGRPFRIYKFRTMNEHAEKSGASVTAKNDPRITCVGSVIRKCRLDELPQLLNVFLGEMSFVGTRPEAFKYVKRYTPEMAATLLLPAGVTSNASIAYKDENRLLDAADDVDEVYVREILPKKMRVNLKSLKNFSVLSDLSVLLRTVSALLK